MTFLRSSHDKPDAELKDAINKDLEEEIMKVLKDEESEMPHTHSRERLGATIAEDAPQTSKENPPNDGLLNRVSGYDLGDALSDEVKERTPVFGDKKQQSTQSEILNDHLHHDVSADPALPICSKDETSGSCSAFSSASHLTHSLDSPPFAHELYDDAEIEKELSLSMDSSKSRASDSIRVDDDINDDAEMIEDEGIFNTDTRGDSEVAFNSVSNDYKSLLSDSTSDENTDMDSDSEGDSLKDDDLYESDDDVFDPSDLSDIDDSSDSALEYENEEEFGDLWYARTGEEEYDSVMKTDEEREGDKQLADFGEDIDFNVEEEAEAGNGAKYD